MTNLKLASKMKCTVVVLGDSRVGKSSLIQRFVLGSFRQQYTPTSFDKSFCSQEVEKHDVEFSFWDTSGSPAYDSVRSLAYHEASVFLLCFKVSDPISLYNIKNKWIGEIRRYRPDIPIILCGCQVDLRNDPTTISHLAKTGRTPVSQELGLAICCEIEAVNYIETSAKMPKMAEAGKDNLEAFELCAVAAMKHKNSQGQNNNSINNNNNQTSSTFQRSPSIHSTTSLFENSEPIFRVGEKMGAGNFKRSPSTNSNLSLAANFKMPTVALVRSSTASVTSLKSPCSEHDVRMLRTFSPEPVSTSSSVCHAAIRIPPPISEHETYQSPVSSPHTKSTSQRSLQTFAKKQKKTRPSSLCDPIQEISASTSSTPPPAPSSSVALSRNSLMRSSQPKLQRPTTLFQSADARLRPGGTLQLSASPHQPLRGSTTNTLFSPSSSSQSGLFFHPGGLGPAAGGIDSELSTPTSSVCSNSISLALSHNASHNMVIKSPQLDVVSPTNAQVRPNGLSRRTSYRTHPKMAIPVATPMSPAGSEFSFDLGKNNRSVCQSPGICSNSDDTSLMQSISEDAASLNSNTPPRIPPPPPPPAPHPHLALRSSPPIPVFDLSFKSHMSTCSASSDGSGSNKLLSSDLSDASSSSLSHRPVLLRNSDLILEEAANLELEADPGDPKVLANMNFVSPKTGVYRPNSVRKAKHGCSIM